MDLIESVSEEFFTYSYIKKKVMDLTESVSEGFPTYSYIKNGNVDLRFKHMIINHPVLCDILSQDLSKVSYLFEPYILQNLKCYLYIR